MLAGKAAAHSDAKYNQDFTECSNFMLNFIQAQPKSTSRNISVTDSNNHAKGKKSFRGKGRGGGGNVHGGTYSPGKWHKLSTNQKAEVKQNRKVKEDEDDKKRTRNTSAVATKEKKKDEGSSDESQDPGSQYASANKGKKGKR
jgi:hypothetical protein